MYVVGGWVEGDVGNLSFGDFCFSIDSHENNSFCLLHQPTHDLGASYSRYQFGMHCKRILDFFSTSSILA